MKEGSSSKGRKKCLAITFIVVITIVLLVVILALVFRPRQPISTVDSVSIKDMDMSMDLFAARLNLNLTLQVDVSVENPNKFGFKFYDGNALLNYRGQLIGDAIIPNEEILAEETKRMNLTLTLMADHLFSNPQALNDVSSGALPLNTLIRISGQVDMLGFIIFHVGSTSSCDFTLYLSNKTIVNIKCQYKTKIGR
ncbi:uncharacterized protein LOC113852295 [Abrus precatorius]|uniref:Uncharacterized protein LOC113852295 n=1 Tax=Abrus precatorius TaxID=3816 RepID=A0A8B8K3U9_ABRPR|nr:uncharacterized protein LOC113852295 [Abrus precatorius]